MEKVIDLSKCTNKKEVTLTYRDENDVEKQDVITICKGCENCKVEDGLETIKT